MTTAPILTCATCAYDLREHSAEDVCPECATPVAESMRVAAVPVRPAWGESDPKWRRRMVAGAWVLVFVPLFELLQWSGLASRIPVPAPYDFQKTLQTLDDAFVSWFYVYPYLAFCVGVVLFFSKEQGRRRHWLDWTRRWGILASYGVLLLGVPFFGFLTALVLIGIAALFQSLPITEQLAVTELFGDLGAGYMYYGPQSSDTADVTLAVFSACAVLLACVPIFNALWSSGPKRLAWVLLVPLALICVWQIGYAALYLLYPPLAGSQPPAFFFFDLGALLAGITDLETSISLGVPFLMRITIETVKWLIFLGIALWLSLAQLRAWRSGRNV